MTAETFQTGMVPRTIARGIVGTMQYRQTSGPLRRREKFIPLDDLMLRAIALIIFALVIIPRPASAATRTIRIGIPGQPYIVGFHVAKARGYYAQENLDVEFVQMAVGIGVNATVAGNVEFAAMGSALFSAILGGAPLKIVMSSFRRPLFLVYAKPEIRDISQLKGKKVGVPALGTAGHSMLVDVLRKQGQDPGRDITMVGLGLTATLLQALIGGVVDAAILSPPFAFMAEDAGYRELISFLDEDIIFPGGGIGAHDSFLRNNSALMEQFTRASLKGHLYARTNKAGTIPIIARQMGMKESYAAKYFDLMRRATTAEGSIDPNEQRKALDPALRLRGDKEAPPLERVYDFSKVRAIGAELRASNWQP